MSRFYASMQLWTEIIKKTTVKNGIVHQLETFDIIR